MPPMVIVSAPLAWPSVIDTLPPVAVIPPLPETVMLSLAALPALIVTDEPLIEPLTVMLSAPSASPAVMVMVAPVIDPATEIVSVPVATPWVRLTEDVPLSAICAAPFSAWAAPTVIRSLAAAPCCTVMELPVTSPFRVMLSLPAPPPWEISTVELPLITIAGAPPTPLVAFTVMLSLAALVWLMVIAVPVTPPSISMMLLPVALPSVTDTVEVACNVPVAATVMLLDPVPPTTAIAIVPPDTAPPSETVSVVPVPPTMVIAPVAVMLPKASRVIVSGPSPPSRLTAAALTAPPIEIVVPVAANSVCPAVALPFRSPW